MRIGSLCSGAGGLDMAVEQVFGASTAWHCEINDAASKVLAYRWPGVRNHRDLINTNWDEVEIVDIMAFGWPCQPFSLAGKQKGAEDERAIWPAIARAIRTVRPRLCVMENVSAVVGSGELARVAGDMAALGYDLRWTCLRASAVGAAHRRERFFAVATDTNDPGSQGPQPAAGRDMLGRGADADPAREGRHEGRAEPARLIRGSDAAIGGTSDVDLLPTPAAARSGRNQSPSPGAAVRPSLDMITDLLPTPGASDGSGGRSPAQSGGRRPSGAKRSVPLTDLPLLLPTPAAADGDRGPDFARADRDGSGGDDLVTICARATQERGSRWGKYADAIARWEQVVGPAPSPTELNSKGNPRLNPAFSEWLMGWPAGWVTEVPGISRNDQLRIIGNGVVPQQATAALTWLLNIEVAA